MACLVSGVAEATVAPYAENSAASPHVRPWGVLAAVGIAFIAAEFAFRIYTARWWASCRWRFCCWRISRYRFPLGIPGGFLAILFGTLIARAGTAWGFYDFGGVRMSGEDLRASLDHVRWIPPVFIGNELDLLTRCRNSCHVPDRLDSDGCHQCARSLQNIESAEAGDRFHTGLSLGGTASARWRPGYWSCFPTTIYIGHPGWKARARSGYSILNGLFFTAMFLFGLGPLARWCRSRRAAIVMYIGIIITAQAFQVTKGEHARRCRSFRLGGHSGHDAGELLLRPGLPPRWQT